MIAIAIRALVVCALLAFSHGVFACSCSSFGDISRLAEDESVVPLATEVARLRIRGADTVVRVKVLSRTSDEHIAATRWQSRFYTVRVIEFLKSRDLETEQEFFIATSGSMCGFEVYPDEEWVFFATDGRPNGCGGSFLLSSPSHLRAQTNPFDTRAQEIDQHRFGVRFLQILRSVALTEPKAPFSFDLPKQRRYFSKDEFSTGRYLQTRPHPILPITSQIDMLTPERCANSRRLLSSNPDVVARGAVYVCSSQSESANLPSRALLRNKASGNAYVIETGDLEECNLMVSSLLEQGTKTKVEVASDCAMR